MPERIDFNGLATTRCDHGVADLGIHPGELQAFSALCDEPIVRIHPNAVSCTFGIGLEDFLDARHELLEEVDVAAGSPCAADGFNEEQRCVSGVVFRWFAASREAVWQHALVDETGEGGEDLLGGYHF